MPARWVASLIITLDNHFSNFSLKTGYSLSTVSASKCQT